MSTHTTPCPYCGAAPGQPCSTRTGQPARQPHTARQQAAEATEATEQPEATDLPVTTIGQALALTDTDDDRQLTIGSLFSGYGGLDLAVEQVTGATPAWLVEFDEAPSKILAHHWPDVPNYGDVTAVQWDEVPRVDIVTGGSPCQDLSQAGKRAGMSEGTRSNLWVNMREAINTIRPRLVVWENVQGALSAKATSDSDMGRDGRPVGDGGGGHLRALGRVLGDLAEIGYDAQWTTVRASDVGAPHHRARVFLIAWPSCSVFDTGHHARRAELGQQHENTAGGARKPSQGAAVTHDERRPDDLGDGGAEVAAAAGRGQTLSHAESGRRDHGQATHDGQADREVHSPRHDSDAIAESVGAGRQAPSHPDGERRHGRNSGKGETGRGQPTDDSGVRIEWGQYAPAIRRWERLAGPAPAPTEPNTRGNPRLAAPFAEWLMGLPSGWVTDVPGLSRADQLKAIGNGVCPQQAAWAIAELLQKPA